MNNKNTLIGHNARDVLRELTKRAELAGFTSQQLTKAISKHA